VLKPIEIRGSYQPCRTGGNDQCRMPNAECLEPNAQCLMPNA
jgi:hypothetical protein